ncbi:2,3-dihydro-2,3-dihydroxybenzoate dehydrogenase [Pseudomonas gessardii]|uniref:2,3-dihydro-2,3-dihydroxybenzoate dehydrogenase n=1 Tax=Pseudomonas gessardii TaxID=78544 RepID=A0A7Y1MPT2_9PSED|nr:2,3-dihydro-2,3-dihydroxybenzoate dehydrogenase [Pseudomonas gessardii]MRU50114.1 2,3-dihydro-2,3-dihydroxybenzoate dehydrogenase [Pseudomonas gessardii]NNA95812.1 2,3-dihydro-2,3-dihydroxybenzoate dehydrogenase [Pseudomonas gessardii]ONH46315.1 2,3-dihydro-2,3-dihydroxybenzoate dehydrogenase [Pseudomonas gessardii]SDR33540.1 2,3-dihydro-2,3-dihydroxybenzoate dehydrogenase [Pseudomonas gessardii]
MNTREFDGKTAWVTGAGRGIGLATATMLQNNGAQVIGLDMIFGGSHYPFECVKLDITDARMVADTCKELLTQAPPPDVLVNAAGILVQGDCSQVSLDDWRHCFDVNVNGAFHLLRILIPMFKERRRGAIVNVASNAASVPRLGMAAYCASKAALLSLSHCVALEVAPYGVRCNSVSPGSTDTPMLAQLMNDSGAVERTLRGVPEAFRTGIPLGKIAMPEEVAQTILFLASERASHITLHDLTVDGGATF